MKILLATGIYPPEIGGPATYSKILVDHFTEFGWEVEVLNFSLFKKYPKIIRHFIYFLKVLLAAKKTELIYALDPVSVGFPATLAAFILRKKIVLKIVGDYAWEQGQQRFSVQDSLDVFLTKKYGWGVFCLRFIQKFSAKKASLIIVPSFYLKKVVKSWGVKEEKIKIVYNAVEIKTAEPIQLKTCPNLLTVGRLVPWKGIDTLIKLMAELTKINSEIKLYIIGDGPQKNYLLDLRKELNLEKQVIFLGSLEHSVVLSYIRATDLFILNSFYEGLSHVLLEAVGLNKFVLASNVGGNSELVEEGKNGSLFKYNDQKQIKEKIVSFLSSYPNGWLGNQDKDIFLDKFSLFKMLDQTSKILYEIINDKS